VISNNKMSERDEEKTISTEQYIREKLMLTVTDQEAIQCLASDPDPVCATKSWSAH
jgi:hypothetical protein